MTTLTTGVRLDEKEWDSSKVCVSFRKATPERAKELLAMQEYLEKIVASLESIVAEKKNDRIEFTVEMLVEEYKGIELSKSFFSLMEHRILLLEEAGQKRTASNYRGTLRMFRTFREDQDVSSDEITALLMEGFEIYLKKRGNGMNTVSYYMRILQAVYNYALEEGWVSKDRKPFKKVFTGEEKTKKRAVNEDVVQKLIHLELNNKPMLDLARDLFLFSIYMRGMAFIDIAHLNKSHIKGGDIIYQRHKTDQKLQIKILPCAQAIIDKYQLTTDESILLFPLLYHPQRKKHTTYETALRMHNTRLQKLSTLLELEVPLSSHVARHTWATLAKWSGVSNSIISEAMGHTSEETTRIYLDSFHEDMVDGANATVISAFQQL